MTGTNEVVVDEKYSETASEVSTRDLWLTWVLCLATPNVLALLFVAVVRGWWCFP